MDIQFKLQITDEQGVEYTVKNGEELKKEELI